MRKILIVLFLLAPAWALASPAHAHPHVFIDARVILHMQNGKVVAITQTWVFDPIFSGVVIGAFDKNKDGKFNAGEVKEVRGGAFQNLKNFNYFTTVRSGGQELKIETVSGFAATVEGNKLRYRFTVRLPRPVDPRAEKAAFLFLDKTYYVAVDLAKKKPVSIAGAAPKGCRAAVKEDTDNPIYFGSVVPLMVVFVCATS